MPGRYAGGPALRVRRRRQVRYLIRRTRGGRHTFGVTGYVRWRTSASPRSGDNNPMVRLSERSWRARLLAFAQSTEPRRTPSASAVGLDVLLACTAAVASLLIL